MAIQEDVLLHGNHCLRNPVEDECTSPAVTVVPHYLLPAASEQAQP